MTTDIRLKRIEKRYQSARDGQDDILDGIDAYEAGALGLDGDGGGEHTTDCGLAREAGRDDEAPGSAAQAAGRLRQGVRGGRECNRTSVASLLLHLPMFDNRC